MSALLHLSDPHFGTEKPDVVEALLALAHTVAPECIILTGDITQRARRAQFDRARRFCDRLPAPVIAVPGNHDIPLFNLIARVFWPYSGYRRVFGDSLEPTWESPTWRVIGVNSTHPRRHKDGSLDAATVERVCARLRQSQGGATQIVALHHPLLAITEADRSNLAHGHVEALQAFAAAGADLVLGGHIHLPYVRPVQAQLPTLARPLWVVQAGTAVSRRTRNGKPNSVHVLRRAGGEAPGVSVEQWDYVSGQRAFVAVGMVRIEHAIAIP